MRKITLVLLIFLVTSTFAQQLFIEGGKTLSSFDYENSQGNRLTNLQATAHSYMTFGYRSVIFTEKLNISFAVGYSGYGAIGSDDNVGNYMKWDLNYLEFITGLDYELFKVKNTKFYLKGSASLAFLLQGTQVMNNKVINLRNKDDFSHTIYDFRAGFGFLHPISDNLSFYIQYMHGSSLKYQEGWAEVNTEERLKYISDNIGFGLLINIEKNK